MTLNQLFSIYSISIGICVPIFDYVYDRITVAIRHHTDRQQDTYDHYHHASSIREHGERGQHDFRGSKRRSGVLGEHVDNKQEKFKHELRKNVTNP